METGHSFLGGNVTRLCVVLMATSLLASCVAPIKYQAAIPQLPADSSGEVHEDLMQLHLRDLTLYAQLQAFDWDGRYLLPPLGLWLNIVPRGAALELDTSRVSLSSDGEAAPTVAYLGPDTAWFSPRALAAGCGPRFYRSGIGLTRFGASQESVLKADNSLGIFRPSNKPVMINGEGCFMFWFDTDSLPSHSFVIAIEGLSRNGESVEIPHIRFEQGTVRGLRTFP